MGDLGYCIFERAKVLHGDNTVWETIPKYNGSGEEREFIIVLGSNNLVVVKGVMPS